MSTRKDLNLSQDTLANLLADGNAPAIIDVRSPEEFATGRIPGAKNVPLTEVAPLFDDRNNTNPMIFICESGIRSLQAANFATLTGVGNVQSLDGGMSAWRATHADKMEG